MTEQPCGLNGCSTPVDPDSGIGRCADCTLSWEAEFLRIMWTQKQRAAEVTGRAAVDAILLAQAFLREDIAGGQAVAAHCDIHSAFLQLAGYLFATMRRFDVDIEERLGIWLTEARAEIGEPS